jgi:hypothetical protein
LLKDVEESDEQGSPPSYNMSRGKTMKNGQYTAKGQIVEVDCNGSKQIAQSWRTCESSSKDYLALFGRPTEFSGSFALDFGHLE